MKNIIFVAGIVLGVIAGIIVGMLLRPATTYKYHDTTSLSGIGNISWGADYPLGDFIQPFQSLSSFCSQLNPVWNEGAQLALSPLNHQVGNTTINGLGEFSCYTRNSDGTTSNLKTFTVQTGFLDIL